MTDTTARARDKSVCLDRRTFLGTAGTVAVVIAASTALPFSAIATEAAAVAKPEEDLDWHIDDMWGHSPRYAQPIPYGRGQLVDSAAALADPLNSLFFA